MKLWVRFTCPKCGFVFPLVPHLSRYNIRDSFFSGYRYRCPKCDLVSRQAVLLPNALWAWPIGTAGTVFLIYLLRTLPFFRDLYDSHPLIYGALGGLSVFPLAVGLLLGMKLVPVRPEDEPKRRARRKAFTFAAVAIACVVGAGILTGKWIEFIALAVGITIGFAVRYLIRGKTKPKE